MSEAIALDVKRNWRQIHEDAMSEAKYIKSRYQKFFDILVEVEKEKIYWQMDITNLRTYCIEMLELSVNVANDFVTVINKSFEVPQLADAIRSGAITISTARKICPVVTTVDYKQWIELAQECSVRTVEKCVAMANPRSQVYETATYIAEDVLEFKLAVSEKWHELLVRNKDLMSQKYRRNITSEEALYILMQENVRRNDPLEKAKRAEKKGKLSLVAVDEGTKADRAMKDADPKPLTRRVDHKSFPNDERKAPSRYRPSDVEHLVNLRDQARCTHIGFQGKRCENRRWLHKHHLIEFSKGGAHDVDNLETLCSGHHRIKHMKEKFVT